MGDTERVMPRERNVKSLMVDGGDEYIMYKRGRKKFDSGCDTSFECGCYTSFSFGLMILSNDPE